MEKIFRNWRTTLSAVIALLIFGLTQYQVITPDIGNALVVIGLCSGLLLASDAKKFVSTENQKGATETMTSKAFKNYLIAGLVVSSIGLSSCTKGSFDAFFKQLEQEIPLQKVSYQIAIPKQDTILNWHSPYQIFVNQTEFRNDTINHQEKFNFSGLGDFLWVEYQNWKAKRKSPPAPKGGAKKPEPNVIPNDAKGYRCARDGLICGSMGVR